MGDMMMMPMPKKQKTYIVLNPRNIPHGIAILRRGDQAWFEGDEMVPPEGMDIINLVARGFLKEVPNA